MDVEELPRKVQCYDCGTWLTVTDIYEAPDQNEFLGFALVCYFCAVIRGVID